MSTKKHITKMFRYFIAASFVAALVTGLSACLEEEGPLLMTSSQAYAGSEHTAAVATKVATCRSCGTITRIKKVEKDGDSDGIGLVTGAVIGGVLGNQVGSGSGKDAATVAGAVGGGYVGNKAEKDIRSETRYRIFIRMDDDGRLVKIKVKSPEDLQVGDRVRLEGGKDIRRI